MLKEISVRTNSRNELVDITGKVRDAVKDVKDGIAIVYVPHTTGAVTINEGADPSVKQDILRKLSELVPEGDNYRHAEGNSDSHIKTTLVGSDVRVFVENGELVLGTWQSIFFCEFDGPRSRKVLVKVIEG